MPAFSVQWTIKGTSKVEALSAHEAEGVAHRLSFSDLARSLVAISPDGETTVRSYSTSVEEVKA
jgi:hypothetical protein